MSHMDDSREPLSRESGRGRDPARSAGRVRVLPTEERPPYTPTFPPLRGGPLPLPLTRERRYPPYVLGYR